MKTIGMFKTKTHLPELIKEVEAGEELCITNRGRKVAVIIPIDKYYKKKYANIFQEFAELKKRAPLGTVDDILEMKNLGRK
ncbi:type II toxin-antitoxin system prevent-host-death family antitoxin [Rickettsia hoogstraalii]|uniref:type II toxin-antitoxin system Phd/YefM family antitoxin n=1 Tax=Rickettsia hoogstraalii TaxID=467174 RepID=UPI000590627B|nr:type II toxin-antitoxin system prevent-host-death family antitoxin [Rickettsia hoogstraalii]MCX4084609.1 type II toxin-antitoxin system prevent-host-death family antitoxin [Rickettsia hoogstraalii]